MLTLLKPFSKKKEELKQPSLSLTGKLPCEADFIRHAITHPNATLVDQWLQASFQQLIKADRLAYPNCFSNIYFYQRFETASQITIGCVYASYDKSGRHYPLVLSKWDAVAKPLEEFMPFVPALYADVWQQFVSFNVAVMQERTLLTQFIRNFEPSSPVVNASPPFQSMMQAVGMPIKQFITGWDNAAHVIAQGLHELMHYAVSPKHALCFPLPKQCEGEAVIPYVAFWLQLCEHLLPNHPWKQVFWHNDHHQPLVWVHWEPLQADLLSWLLVPALRQQEKRVLCVTGGQQLALLTKVKQWLDRDTDTVCQLLHTILKAI